MNPAGAKSKRSIQSVGIAFRLIRVLEVAQGPMSLKSLSAAAGMSASKAHLYLVSLCNVGLVIQEADSGYYALGPYALQLGLASIAKIDLVHHARKTLLELRDATGEATFLSIKGSSGPCVVAKVDSLQDLPMVVRVGFTLPLAGSATGLVFMAFADPEWVGRSLKSEHQHRYTARNGMRPPDLASAIKHVKSRGFAKIANLVNPGDAALSAPVFDHEGHFVGALTLMGPVSDFSKATEAKLSKLLLGCTRRLSQTIGYRLA